jgi:hypothetical protein
VESLRARQSQMKDIFSVPQDCASGLCLRRSRL